jgi:hypothetical protein
LTFEIKPSVNVTEALEKLVREAKHLGIRVTIARKGRQNSRMAGRAALVCGSAEGDARAEVGQAAIPQNRSGTAVADGTRLPTAVRVGLSADEP